MRHLLLAAVGMAAALAGCAGGDWEAVRYESGDTTVVRTVSGSGWGSARLVERARIDPDPSDTVYALRSVSALAFGRDGSLYVADPRGRMVRAYDEAGRFRHNIRPGPGEPGGYSEPNGLAVLDDGRVVIRDPRRSQMVVYSERGNFLERWRLPDGLYSALPPLLDDSGDLYTHVVLNPDAPPSERWSGLIRYSPPGVFKDTIPDPEFDFSPLSLNVESSRGETVRYLIPLTARAYWARSPNGDVVRAISSGYSLDVVKPDGSVVRIEREYMPAEASREERTALYQKISESARQIDYRWTWRGPVIPEEKPPFKAIFTDRDSRIWVQLHQPAVLAGGDRATASVGSPNLPSAADFVEPVVFDVFEPDGRYLGELKAPEGFRTLPLPVIEGSTVWAVVSDGDAPASLVRYEIVH